MRKIIFFCIVSIFASLFWLNSISISSEIKTLDDLKNSSFYKKYPQKNTKSWPLKIGGYSYAGYIDLKIDKHSLVLLEVLTKSKDNPIIYGYSMIFHAGYTKQMKAFFYDFFSSVDSSLDSKAVINYIQTQAAVELLNSSDAPKKTFGKYSVSVSNLLNAVTVSIEKGLFAEPASKPTGKLTREQVFTARKRFKVQVISFDASQAFGIEYPYSDYVCLRITNNSNVTLPYLTVLTKRYDGSGKFLGSSRMPPIPADSIKPGESVEYDYYPKGHFDPIIAVTKKITVEIEQVIDQESMRFFKELQ